MKKYVFTLILLSILISCKEQESKKDTIKKVDFALVIHGGAGNIYKGKYFPAEEVEYIAKLIEALNIGYNILAIGGSSLDAVEKTINYLEDSPLFNAGKGAVLTNTGVAELDASIMYGKDLSAGAVARLQHIKNPISLARLVMEKSNHVFLVSDGAEIFAKENGVELVDNSYFITEENLNRLKKAKEEEMIKSQTSRYIIDDKIYGTVGCVALDKQGNIAAGTSTGGMMNKKYGRVGDSPIIGAGTYANNNTCGISCTGHGEFFIRNVVAHDISVLVEYKKLSLQEAADLVIKDKLKKQNATGGIISIDKFGNIVWSFNTPGMFRGSVTNKNNPIVKIYDE